MTKIFVAVALATSALYPGVASAADLEPDVAHGIRLGEYGGVVYYTPKRTGFHVVATLGSAATVHPIRVVSEMKQGDTLLLSAPQAHGRPSVAVTIYREGDSLVVTDPIFMEAQVEEASAAGAGALPH